MKQVSYVKFKSKDGSLVEINTESSQLEFLGIEEDVFGRDKMTFKYKGEEYESLVYLRYE
jgi:hypothetical protein